MADKDSEHPVKDEAHVRDPEQNDDVYLIDPPDEAAAGTAETLPRVEKELLELRKERDELYDRLLRKQADFENFRKRNEKEKREYHQYAVSEMVLDLLPILDNFERSFSHAEELTGEYRKGIELIYRQFRDLLEKRGLQAIKTQGEPFDPNYHEAIAREFRPELPDNTIIGELQKGYMFRDRLLRPAMVKVSFGSGSSDETSESRAAETIDTE